MRAVSLVLIAEERESTHARSKPRADCRRERWSSSSSMASGPSTASDVVASESLVTAQSQTVSVSQADLEEIVTRVVRRERARTGDAPNPGQDGGSNPTPPSPPSQGK